MGTPMAVNYANCFMGKYEKHLLNSYEQQYGKRPALWLRFIDDVFVVWQGSAEEFKHFIHFCEHFAASKQYKSQIRFTSSGPSSSAVFLDTTVTVNDDGTLSTDLYTKPTASFQYLHHSSYHNPPVTTSLPKSQFMRIRRICSNITDYDRHVKRFTEHFVKRKFHRKKVEETAQSVREMNREDLLTYKKPQTNERIPLVLTYHHKFEGFGSAMKTAYKRASAKFPALQSLFPQPPMIAFRRTRNIRDKIIRANHHGRQQEQREDHAEVSVGRSLLARQMNHTRSITNRKTNRTLNIEGGPASTVGAIYAAECTKHHSIYIGQTERQLNLRFNNHRSDVEKQPHVCKLTEHFHNNNCNLQSDLQVSVLEQVTGSKALREYKEDRWITRLQTTAPGGMNASFATDYGPIYKKLFM